jgi:hypothetical protein
MTNYVLRMKGKMNECRRMLVSNNGGCMLEMNNMSIESRMPNYVKE